MGCHASRGVVGPRRAVLEYSPLLVHRSSAIAARLSGSLVQSFVVNSGAARSRSAARGVICMPHRRSPVQAGYGHLAGEASGGSVAFSPNSRGKRCARSGSRHQPSSPWTIPGCAW